MGRLLDRFFPPPHRIEYPPPRSGWYLTAHVCANPLGPNCTEPVYSDRDCPWCGGPRRPIRPPGRVYMAYPDNDPAPQPPVRVTVAPGHKPPPPKKPAPENPLPRPGHLW